MSSKNFTRQTETARKFGLHEITLTAGTPPGVNPFSLSCRVSFIPPSGESNAVTVDAFYDGGDTWRARLYVMEPGGWSWHSSWTGPGGGAGASGSFDAGDSPLRGKLRRHTRNRKSFMTDDGRWFCNLNDTGYAIFREDSRLWFEYVRDNWDTGITSMRVTAFGRSLWSRIFADYDEGRGPCERFDLEEIRRMDERMEAMLDHYPGLYLQFILLPHEGWGVDDSFALTLPAGKRERFYRYVLARFAAYPQIFWLFQNDAHYGPDFRGNSIMVDEAGRFFAANDPWDNLRATGPFRRSIYPFAGAAWNTYIHIENEYDYGADEIYKYERCTQPVFLGEDRYEQDRATRDPLDPPYCFRRLFWSWLLSGGSASYGGRWEYIHPYSMTGELVYTNKWKKPDGSPHRDGRTYTERMSGLDSIPALKRYFEERNIELCDFTPDDARAADLDGRAGKNRPKCTRRGEREFIVYHPNSSLDDRRATPDRETTARLRLDLTGCEGTFVIEWFRARNGEVQEGSSLEGGGPRELVAPWKGEDVVVRALGTGSAS